MQEQKVEMRAKTRATTSTMNHQTNWQLPNNAGLAEREIKLFLHTHYKVL